jgi:hypothetical protein
MHVLTGVAVAFIVADFSSPTIMGDFSSPTREASSNSLSLVIVLGATAAPADMSRVTHGATPAASALGLIHEIIIRELVDLDYVNNYTIGSDKFVERAPCTCPSVSPRSPASGRGHPQACT